VCVCLVSQSDVVSLTKNMDNTCFLEFLIVPIIHIRNTEQNMLLQQQY